MQQLVLLYIFLLLAGTLVLAALAVYRMMSGSSMASRLPGGWWLPVSVSALALALRLWCVPSMHHVYYDEFAYMAEAHNILCFAHPGQVLRGSRSAPEIFSASANLRTGFPVLLALAEATVPDMCIEHPAAPEQAERRLFWLNIGLGVLSVAMLYRIILRATATASLAGWSAVVLAVLPAHIKYSASLSADVSVLFFFLLSLMCLLEWAAVRQKLFMLTALFAGAYSACIKPIYLPFLAVALLAVTVPLYRRKELRGRELGDILYYACCTLLPLALFLAPGAASETHGRSDLLYSWGHWQKNILPNLLSLLDRREFNVVASLLALAGLGWVVTRRRDGFIMAMMLWFCLGFILLAGYFAGGLSYQSFTTSDRFFFVIAAPFALLAAVGARSVCVLVGRWGRSAALAAATLMLVALCVNGIYASRHIVAYTSTRFVYKQWLFVRKTAPLLPADAALVCADSAFISVMTAQKVLRGDLFLSGDRPLRIVYYTSSGCPGAAPEVRSLGQVIRSQYTCDLLYESLLPGAEGCTLRAQLCTKAAPAPTSSKAASAVP
ncbi:MAG: phospholipid carrier-dependent glycosyltransferase [Candidatus Omnitrophica bacterium]|nr:phospholipid carrier-dependent glycosyltransferase [Candidatus Omnitrophota bacterium]